MRWIKVTDDVPDSLDDCLVTDGCGSYAVAYYSKTSGLWHPSEGMLNAENDDGGAAIYLSENVVCWTPIRPLEDEK